MKESKSKSQKELVEEEKLNKEFEKEERLKEKEEEKLNKEIEEALDEDYV